MNYESRKLTIDENNRLFNGGLVRKLRLKELGGEKHSLLSALIPAHMEVINIDLSQVPHHLHLIVLFIKVFIKVLWKRETVGNFQKGISH